MHDTTFPNQFDDAIFNPETKFLAGSEAEFIREYRHQLAVLKLRVQSDYTDLHSKFHQQQRRLDSLEAVVPQVRMQQQQLADALGDLRAIKRSVTELQIDVAQQKRSVLGRLSAALDRIHRALVGE